MIPFGQKRLQQKATMKKPAILLAAIIALIPAWISAPAQQAADRQPSCAAASCPYLNPALAPEARAKDLVSRMTLEEKVSQTQDVAPAIPRLGVPAYNWWNEALHGVARNGFATVFPAIHRPRSHLGHSAHAPGRDGYLG